MTNKKTLILVGVLVVGAAVTLILDAVKKSGPSDPRIGKPILESSHHPQIAKIEFKKSDKTVVLKKAKENIWRIESGENFPVDAKKIAKFFDELGKTKFQSILKNVKDQAADFGLDSPTVVVVSSSAKELINLNLGNRRDGGGQYVSLANDSNGFLTSKELKADADEESWELKTLIDLKKEKIKGLEFFSPKSKVASAVLSREKAEDKLMLEGIGKKDKINESAVNSAAGILENLSFKSRFDLSNEEAKTALLKPHKAIATLFDSRKYEILTGSVGKDDKAKHFVKIVPAKGDAALAEEDLLQFQQLSGIMGKWSFEINSYSAKKFQKSKKDFLDQQKK